MNIKCLKTRLIGGSFHDFFSVVKVYKCMNQRTIRHIGNEYFIPGFWETDFMFDCWT